MTLTSNDLQQLLDAEPAYEQEVPGSLSYSYWYSQTDSTIIYVQYLSAC